MMHIAKLFRALFASRACVGIALMAISFFSCRTAPTTGNNPSAEKPSGEKMAPPIAIMGMGGVGERRLIAFFLENNPTADRAKVARMAAYYVEEANLEGVNPDVAFMQMCLETGFLRFGGLVTEDMNNFCGLGSIGPGQPGNRFPDERTGVRAHVQHLKAYGSPEALVGTAVDPRYRYVNPKGKSPLVAGLSGTWAADPQYGAKLSALLARLYG